MEDAQIWGLVIGTSIGLALIAAGALLLYWNRPLHTQRVTRVAEATRTFAESNIAVDKMPDGVAKEAAVRVNNALETEVHDLVEDPEGSRIRRDA